MVAEDGIEGVGAVCTTLTEGVDAFVEVEVDALDDADLAFFCCGAADFIGGLPAAFFCDLTDALDVEPAGFESVFVFAVDLGEFSEPLCSATFPSGGDEPVPDEVRCTASPSLSPCSVEESLGDPL
ncbi:MAG: hypothetical protein WBA57_14980 [Elainellaceae cyanobacterium]